LPYLAVLILIAVTICSPHKGIEQHLSLTVVLARSDTVLVFAHDFIPNVAILGSGTRLRGLHTGEIMDIDLPSDDNSSNDDSVFGGRIDLYEAYWLYVDGVRCVGPVLRQSPATREDTDRSPLARHYNHFYEKKESHKEKCSDLPGSLPKYKAHFGEPRGDVQKVPKENLEDLGIELNEGDDPIWLPPEYELPSVWEDDLKSMDEEELRERIRELQTEKAEIQTERDELREKLAEVGRSLSNYLELEQDDESSTTTSPRTCEKCGRTFDSKSAKHGHLSHCKESKKEAPANQSRSQAEPETEELEQLAEELPELGEQQTTEGQRNVSAEEELENLNHLLSGSL
jgi:predicted Zn-ribbon and HTH transcriptional regulator